MLTKHGCPSPQGTLTTGNTKGSEGQKFYLDRCTAARQWESCSAATAQRQHAAAMRRERGESVLLLHTGLFVSGKEREREKSPLVSEGKREKRLLVSERQSEARS